jgi:hypothetical protein
LVSSISAFRSCIKCGRRVILPCSAEARSPHPSPSLRWLCGGISGISELVLHNLPLFDDQCIVQPDPHPGSFPCAAAELER